MNANNDIPQQQQRNNELGQKAIEVLYNLHKLNNSDDHHVTPDESKLQDLLEHLQDEVIYIFIKYY